MRVLFTSLREKSHLYALTPFIQACVARGHAVGVAAPQDFAERVAALGVQFFPVGHPGDEGLRPIWAKFRGASAEELARIATGECFAGACAGAAIPSVLEIIDAWRPSIVLRESYEYSGSIAAEKRGVAHGRIAICAPGGEACNRAYAAPFVDAHRRALGLSEPLEQVLQREPALTLFPASFEPSASMFRYRVERGTAPTLPSFWGSAPGAFVYATLGTVAGGLDLMRGAYGTVLEALRGLPLRALLTIGSGLPLEALAEVPANVQIERFVPQDHVIPHASAVLCHGGSGTVLGALAAGVPLIISPFFADQPHNARCVTANGAGIGLGARETRPEVLRNALERVLGEPAFRVAAQRHRREIAALPPLAEAAIEIERLAAG